MAQWLPLYRLYAAYIHDLHDTIHHVRSSSVVPVSSLTVFATAVSQLSIICAVISEVSQLVDEALFSNYAALTGYRVANVRLSSASAAISRICNT